MTSVQHWAGTVCCIVLASSIIQNMLPRSRLSRSVRMILGLLLLLAILSPLAVFLKNAEWGKISFPANALETENYLEHSNRQILDLAKKNIQKIVAKELQKEGIEFKKIEVDMDTDGDNCICIEQVRISIPVQQSEQAEKIRNQIERTLEIHTEVEYVG